MDVSNQNQSIHVEVHVKSHRYVNAITTRLPQPLQCSGSGCEYYRSVMPSLLLILTSYSHFSTAKRSDVRKHALSLLNRHCTVFGNHKWTDFDDEFLKKHVQYVAIVDVEDMVR